MHCQSQAWTKKEGGFGYQNFAFLWSHRSSFRIIVPNTFLGVKWKKKKKRWRALHHRYCFHVLNGKLMVNSERFVKILLKLDCLWKVNDWFKSIAILHRYNLRMVPWLSIRSLLCLFSFYLNVMLLSAVNIDYFRCWVL